MSVYSRESTQNPQLYEDLTVQSVDPTVKTAIVELERKFNVNTLMITLPKPVGYENICYTHYMAYQPTFGVSNFTFFLHGDPRDHLEK